MKDLCPFFFLWSFFFLSISMIEINSKDMRTIENFSFPFPFLLFSRWVQSYTASPSDLTGKRHAIPPFFFPFFPSSSSRPPAEQDRDRNGMTASGGQTISLHFFSLLSWMSQGQSASGKKCTTKTSGGFSFSFLSYAAQIAKPTLPFRAQRIFNYSCLFFSPFASLHRLHPSSRIGDWSMAFFFTFFYSFSPYLLCCWSFLISAKVKHASRSTTHPFSISSSPFPSWSPWIAQPSYRDRRNRRTRNLKCTPFFFPLFSSSNLFRQQRMFLQ